MNLSASTVLVVLIALAFISFSPEPTTITITENPNRIVIDSSFAADIDDLDLSLVGDEIIGDYKGTEIIRLRPSVIYLGTERTMAEIKTAFPAIQFKNHIDRVGHWKFALNFSNIPENVVNNTDYIIINLVSSQINWSRTVFSSDVIAFPNGYILDFDDLTDNNFTVNISKADRRILIGNLSVNYDQGNLRLFLDPTIQSSCGTLSSANTEYILNESVSSTGTCFTIGATNITLDGDGFLVNYSQSSGGNGIAIENDIYDDFTVKNIQIYEAVETSSRDNYGIIIDDADSVTIQNSTIITLNSSAIFIVSSSIDHVIDNNTIISGFVGIRTNDDGGGDPDFTNITNNDITTIRSDGAGIELNDEGDRNMVINNTINSSFQGIASGDLTNSQIINNTIVSIGDGIRLVGLSTNNVVDNNLINSSDNGIWSTDTSAGDPDFNNITNNIINVDGAGYGINLDDEVGDNLFINNTITTTADNSFGIYMEQSLSVTAENNTIITSGDGSHGIVIEADSQFIIIINNEINTSGTGSDGISLNDAGNLDPDFNNFTFNRITTIGSTAHGYISNDEADFAVLRSNNITVNGSSSYGIYLLDTESNTIINNTVISEQDVAIRMSSTSTINTFYNNVINGSSTYVDLDGTLANDWNITEATGTNIVGGSNVGGNFYANSTHDGFSQTCVDGDSDDICDVTLLLGTNNNDSLPLSVVSEVTPPAIELPEVLQEINSTQIDTTTSGDPFWPNQRVIVRSGNNTLHVAYLSAFNQVKYARSEDNGSTWSLRVLRDELAYAPHITTNAFDIVISYAPLATGTLRLVRSTDDGFNWENVTTNVGASFEDQSVYLRGDNLYSIYEVNNAEKGVNFTKSDDKGDSFGAETRLFPDDFEHPGSAVNGTGGSTDILYAAAINLTDGSLYFTRSTDSGDTWSALVMIADNSSFANVSRLDLPSISYNEDELYIAVWGVGNDSNRGSVIFINSSDNGATFDAAQRIDDNVDAGNNIEVIRPIVTTGLNNEVWILWEGNTTQITQRNIKGRVLNDTLNFEERVRLFTNDTFENQRPIGKMLYSHNRIEFVWVNTTGTDQIMYGSIIVDDADFPPPPIDITPPVLSNFQAFAINGTFDIIGESASFNTTNLEEIEYMLINFTLTDPANISDFTLFFSANGSGGCSLGNLQSNVCYNLSNAINMWIRFSNGTITETYDGTEDGGNQGDQIEILSVEGPDSQRNYSIRIDEHYNPNVFKWYSALFNFSAVKWQDGTAQRITKGNMIKVEINNSLVPLIADQYKLDVRINTSDIPSDSNLLAFACNSSYTTGNPGGLPECALVSSQHSSEFTDDGTKHRSIFTNDLVEDIGDIRFIILDTDENNPNRYYTIRTYNITNTTHTQKWEFTQDNGGSWSNSNDGYESELNINWFINGGDPTQTMFRIESNDSLGNMGNSSNFNITWDIDPTQNYAPIVNIDDPAVDNNVSEIIEINWTTVDPNDDLWLTNITIVNGSGVTELIASNLVSTIFKFNWTTTNHANGTYNLTVLSWENETTDGFASNNTHEIFITNEGGQSLSNSAEETFTFIDIDLREFDGIRQATDILSFVESILRTLSGARTMDDIIRFIDDHQRNLDLNREFTDSVFFSDIIDREWSIFRSFDDIIIFVDGVITSVTEAGVFSESVSDIIRFTDETLRIFDPNRFRSDVIRFVDSLFRTSESTRPSNDIIRFVDGSDRIIDLNREFTDSVFFSDVVNRNWDVSRPLDDIIRFVDRITTTITGEFSESIIDSFRFIDETARLLTWNRLNDDIIRFVDSSFGSAGRTHSTSDVIRFTDGTERQIDFTREFGDSIIFREFSDRIWILARAFDDIIRFIDEAITDLTGIVLSVTINQPQNISQTVPNITLNVTSSFNDDVDVWWYTNDSGSTNVTFTPNTTIDFGSAGNGTFVLIVYANHTNSSIASATVNFSINTGEIPEFNFTINQVSINWANATWVNFGGWSGNVWARANDTQIIDFNETFADTDSSKMIFHLRDNTLYNVTFEALNGDTTILESELIKTEGINVAEIAIVAGLAFISGLFMFISRNIKLSGIDSKWQRIILPGIQNLFFFGSIWIGYILLGILINIANVNTLSGIGNVLSGAFIIGGVVIFISFSFYFFSYIFTAINHFRTAAKEGVRNAG